MFLSSIDQALQDLSIAAGSDFEEQKELDFWTKRAMKYNRLQWAANDEYLRSFLNAGLFSKDDLVLDIGTGTGIVANELSHHVRQVVGIDISHDMLEQAACNKKENQEFILCDAGHLNFNDNKFTKVTARMVFHHLIDKTEKTISEAYRVLANEGLMILSEGVPPDPCVEQFYREMFALKEERLTFFEEDLVGLMKHGGFKEIKVHEIYLKDASIRNWLENSGLDQQIQNKIYNMHLNLHDQGKKAYNMKIEQNDIKIDMKFLILVGQKIH